MSQILVELIKLANLIITLNKASASSKRVFDIMDTPTDIEKKISEERSAEASAVSFKNVSFRYHEGGDYAVSDISFTANKGDVIGIIGGTGSGKSTLVNLIPAFYTPSEGNIFINGKNASLYDKNELTQMFGVVSQKAVLFKGTIRSNLLWGKNDATENELWAALSLAQADDFVKEKEGGLDASVEQSGRNLSGGQRQRLSIARALIKRPEFLILDDSASALDYSTESRLRSSLSGLDYSPTTFIISQRASSIMHADKILVLDDGRIVDEGTHNELLNTCDIYREIYQTQFSEGGNK